MRAHKSAPQPVAAALVAVDWDAPAKDAPPLLAREHSGFRLLLGAGDLLRLSRRGPMIEAVVVDGPGPDESLCEAADTGRATVEQQARLAHKLHSRCRLPHFRIACWLGLSDAAAACRLAWLASERADPYLLERASDPACCFTPAHARLVSRMSNADQRRWAAQAVAHGLSVRALSDQIRKGGGQGADDADLATYATEVGLKLGSQVSIVPEATGFRVSIDWTTALELAGVLEKIGAAPNPEPIRGYRPPHVARQLLMHLHDSHEVDTLFGHLRVEQSW